MWIQSVSRRGAPPSAFAVLIAGFVALMACYFAPVAAAAPPAAKSYIVVLEDDVAHPASLAHRHEDNRGAEVGHIYGTAIKGYSAELTPGGLAAIRQDPNVDYVERDGEGRIANQIPSLAFKRVFAASNPALDVDEVDDVRINADVAILDTGVGAHNDLNIAGRTDCVTPTTGCLDGQGGDGDGHGTHVAGIAGALDNSFGVIGTAPGARIWSVKVIPDHGEFAVSDVLAGIDWVTAHSSQIEVANMSFSCVDGFNCSAQAMHEAVAASVDKGVVYVAAAGNGSSDAFSTAPAYFPEVVAVGAVTDFDGLPGGLATQWCIEGGPDELGQDDGIASYSNFGPAVDIYAPGTCIFSTYAGGGYGILSGTSMASPLVAGAAAVLAAASNPNTRADVEAIISNLRGSGNFNWTYPGIRRAGAGGAQQPFLDMSKLVAAPSLPPKPTVTTGEPTDISQTKAKLSGAVNPNGVSTIYFIEWGPTTYYGNTVSGSAGAGTSTVGVSTVAEGLYPGTTYHYRVRAESAGGSVLGPDKQFTTPKQPTVFFSDAGRSGSMTRWSWENSVGWQQTPMNGDSIAAGTKPSPVMIAGTPHVFFNDASAGNTLADWSRNGSTGSWEMNRFYGSTMAPKSSPSAVVANGVAHVFFVDANRNNTISDWVLKNPTAGWEQVPFYGDSVSPGSSPSAIAYGLNAQVYFSDASKSNTIALWTWSPSSIKQQFFYGDSLSPGSSPSAIMNGSNPQVYFSDASKSNTIAAWTWTPTALTPQFFYGDGLSAGSSPSAIMNGSTPEIYFADAPKSSTTSVWKWTPSALTMTPLFGASVATGSSPVATLIG